jgi:hypothetical protein
MRSRAIAAGLVVAASLLPSPSASAERPPRADLEGCYRPDAPRSFHRHVVRAIRISGDLPRAWSTSPLVAKLACWQGSGFRTDFRDRRGGSHVWHGLFAMTVEEMQTVFGRWMTADRDAFRLTSRCFVHGWDACPHRIANTAAIQQLIAGMRWIWLNYGTPTAAWTHIKRTGRFTSYPRPGTDDDATRTPLRRCPVAGRVFYRDSFGERRTVGGYHPHWGNDVVAPTGRAIRAPFDGFAVAHRDTWFAGLWVTVVGRDGYVRNDHLSRFAKRGWVDAGDVIGYVGGSGDARSPHDHVEWHPWVVPVPLHRSPFGFRRIMDAIDPYPFLNKVCGSHRTTRAPAGVTEPLEG